MIQTKISSNDLASRVQTHRENLRKKEKSKQWGLLQRELLEKESAVVFHMVQIAFFGGHMPIDHPTFSKFV